MKEDIIKCIIKKEEEKRENYYKEIFKQQQKQQLEEKEKKEYIPKIKNFFSNIPKNIMIEIKLSEPRHSFFTDSIPINPELRMFQGISSVMIDTTHDEMKIYTSHDIFGSYPLENWGIGMVKQMYRYLPWFEEQIAKQYGCENNES